MKMGINFEVSDKASFNEEYGQHSRNTQVKGKSKTRLYKTDIANSVLKDTRFNLQEERLYIRNVKHNAQMTSICFFIQIKQESTMCFPTTLTNPQRIMVSSCFEEHLNYPDKKICKTEDSHWAEQSKSLVMGKTKLFHNNSNLL